MLRVENMTYSIGGRTLFEDASVHIPAGHRVGMVGRNGSGKTTLLRLIQDIEELDSGSILVRKRSLVQMVAQEAPGGEQSPLEAVLAADESRSRLLEEADDTADPDRIGEIHNQLIDMDAHAAPARAASILTGLGFDEAAQHRPLKSFSGGYRMRVALAAVLFVEPDLLLLDEPTNHLDLESAMWLENHLKHYPSTLLMVSHDRGFLTNAVEHILHLDDGKLEMYRGGYDTFERVRFARQEQSEAQRTKQEADRKRIQSFVDRFRAKATKARQAQSRLKLLEKFVPIAAAPTEPQYRFHFPDPLPTSSPLVRLNGAETGYVPGKPVLTDLHFSVYKQDRIALLGTNGNGKTTLSKLISGKLKPWDGEVFRTSKIQVGYFAQDQLEELQPTLTALAQMSLYMPDASPTEVRGWLGRFGLGQNQAGVSVSGLSGGEKTRLAIAIVASKKPNLLVLDEPTNHLDMDSRKALVKALTEYDGAIILVSHDRHLIEATADQLWLVSGGTAKAFFGDLDEYRKTLLEEGRSLRAAKRETKAADTDKRDRKEDRRAKAEQRKRLAPLKKQAETAEKTLEVLTAEKDEIDATLADPATYSESKDKIATLTTRQKKLEAQIERAEEQWLEAQAAMEEALEQ